MARRSDHTREELQLLAINAGQKLLREGGLQGFSARKVAAEIGYTVGTLYHIFEHHNALLLAINAVTLDDLRAAMEKSGKGKTGQKALESLAFHYLQFAEKNYPRWKALFDHTLPEEIPLPDWYAEKLAAAFVPVEKALSPLVKGNAARARTESRILWAGIHGIAMLALTGKLGTVQAGKPRQLIGQFIETYCAGLLSIDS